MQSFAGPEQFDKLTRRRLPRLFRKQSDSKSERLGVGTRLRFE
jgi:hypothetical protein